MVALATPFGGSSAGCLWYAFRPVAETATVRVALCHLALVLSVGGSAISFYVDNQAMLLMGYNYAWLMSASFIDLRLTNAVFQLSVAP